MAVERSYLDWNASAPLLPEAREAMLRALDGDANPSSVHQEGRAARALIEEARASVAALLDADPDAVVFTSGATEAAVTLLTPAWTLARAPLPVSRLYVCAADHPCTLSGGRFPASAVTRLPVDESGLLRLEALERALAAHDASLGAALVAVHAANNETGVVQPWERIAELVHAANGLLVLDAVQAAGRVSLARVLAHADAVILSSHKIGGPKGAGAFVLRENGAAPSPLVTGGGQERGLRAGTPNTAALAGFGAAAALAPARLPRMNGVAALRDRFEAALCEAAPDAVVFGGAAPRLPNTLFFSVPGLKAETAQIGFDLAGVALSAGSACSSGKVGPSHVLAAMGVRGGEGALRVSIGPETTDGDLARFQTALAALLRRRTTVARAA